MPISKNQILLQLYTPPWTIPLGGQLNILHFDLVQQLSFGLVVGLFFPLSRLPLTTLLHCCPLVSLLGYCLTPELLQQPGLKILVGLFLVHDFIRRQLKTLPLSLTDTILYALATTILMGECGIETASECLLEGYATFLRTGEDYPRHLRTRDPFTMPLDVFLQLSQPPPSRAILDLIFLGLSYVKGESNTGYGRKLYRIHLQKTQMLDTAMAQGGLHACQSLQLFMRRAILGRDGSEFQLGHKIMHRRKDQQGVEATLRFIRYSSSHIRPRVLYCIRFT